MKLFIVADMEGATGVVHPDELGPEGGEPYREACRMLTGDVNAAIEGAVNEGVSEVVVSEGHGNMRNLQLGRLHPAARLVRGPAQWLHKPLCQVQGLRSDFDLAFFVGFHSRAGTEGGLLSHTWAGAVVHEITLNGKPAGETLINAAICGEASVPVGLVVGADDACREAEADLPGVVTAATKIALGRSLAECWTPDVTAERIVEAAAQAVQRHGARPFAPTILPGPVTAELEVHRRRMTDHMVLVPGVERVGERRLRVVGDTAQAALTLLWRAISEGMRKNPEWLA